MDEKEEILNVIPCRLKHKTFEQQLSDLINRESLENISDTPDYILARYLNRCLEAYNKRIAFEIDLEKGELSEGGYEKVFQEGFKPFLNEIAKAYRVASLHKDWWFRPKEHIDSPLPDLVQKDEERGGTQAILHRANF